MTSSGPWRTAASSASEAARDSGLGQRHASLALVLATAIAVRGSAHLVGFEKQHLRDAFVGVDLRGERRGVGKFQRDVTFPLGFQRSYVHYYPATRERAFSDRENEHVARDAKVLDSASQRERVRWNDAHIAAEVDEALLVEVLRVDDGGVDVGEDLELVRAAHVVAVAGGAIGHDPAAVHFAHLSGLERLDHRVLARHAADPVVGLDAHVSSI